MKPPVLPLLLALAGPALAEEPPVPAEGLPQAAPVVKPAPPPAAPYSLPWQLRPVLAASVLRVETSIAYSEPPTPAGNSAATVATMLLGSFKIPKTELFPFVRIGFVDTEPTKTSATVARGFSFLNPVIGVAYSFKLPLGFRIAPVLAVTLPVGMGGGNTPDAGAAAANRAGIPTRSSMDNAMFSPNYSTLIPGVGAAWIGKGFTVQAEFTFFALMRTRGEQKDTDAFRMNFTAGIHVGYFIIPQLSVGAEFRAQVWLYNPFVYDAPARKANREQMTIAAGLRGHFRLANRVWFRPGVSYTRGLDDPMDVQNYNIVQLDLPFVF